jgi:hypothetical protein
MKCSELVRQMTELGIINNFNHYCVDDNLDKLPAHITEVPMLIVKDIPKPLDTHSSFEWIKTVKFMRQQQMLEMNKKIIQANIQNSQSEGPLGFANMEMGGFSDTFAFTQTDLAPAHSFFQCKSESNNAIFTAPEQGKIKKGDQDKYLQELKLVLKEQDEQYSKIMKTHQMEAVIMSEQMQLRDQQMTKPQHPRNRNIR